MKKPILLGLLVLGLGLVAGCQGGMEVEMKKPANQEEVQEERGQEEAADQGEVQVRPKARGILLSTTLGPVDAGLIDALIDAYTEDHPDRTVRYLARGTGRAIDVAKEGNIDLLIVHAKSLEEAFVKEGYGTDRIPLMYNDFVLVGPGEDPASVKEEVSVQTALRTIQEGAYPFVSRGDQSGTHVKELEVWVSAGIEPQGDWYDRYAKGAEGNKATLLYADERNAYTIIDRATYIANKGSLKNLDLLFEGDDILKNEFTIIPVNPERFANINDEDAADFIAWLISPQAQAFIAAFGVETYGQALFTPNADAPKDT